MALENERERRGITCQISAFEVDDPTPVGPEGEHTDGDRTLWLAIASAQVYDRSHRPTPLTEAQSIVAGETMRVFSARATGGSEANAMFLALKGLLFELSANGFSESSEVTLA